MDTLKAGHDRSAEKIQRRDCGYEEPARRRLFRDRIRNGNDPEGRIAPRREMASDTEHDGPSERRPSARAKQEKNASKTTSFDGRDQESAVRIRRSDGSSQNSGQLDVEGPPPDREQPVDGHVDGHVGGERPRTGVLNDGADADANGRGSATHEVNEGTRPSSGTNQLPLYCLACQARRQQTPNERDRRFRSSYGVSSPTPETVATEAAGGGASLSESPPGGGGEPLRVFAGRRRRLPSSGQSLCPPADCTRVRTDAYRWREPTPDAATSPDHRHPSILLEASGLLYRGTNANRHDLVAYTRPSAEHDVDHRSTNAVYRSHAFGGVIAPHSDADADADADFGFELPLHRLVRDHALGRDLLTDLYLEYYRDFKVPDRLLSGSPDRSHGADIAPEHPLRSCVHHGIRQVAAQRRMQSACVEVNSSVNCANLTTKAGFSSDSAYCSLERHVTSFQYQPLVVYEGHVTHSDLDSDGEMEEDSGTEECSSSDTDVTFVMDPTTYTREKLNQRTKDMLTVLKEQFSKLIQEVSEELVRLLQERHELKEQVEMRKIAVEQLVRLQGDAQQVNRDNRQHGVVISRDE